ncbi:helix-turn-helix domain-containing protein [Nocardia farcinica]|uniref:helix-turn-helix domain-containing protein n=1 Tax=Nocardia farcinica TaxID=37329 RepID=UPI000BFA26E0|nr:helix-turn-helix domain-containing protein [Nocardia farcinica]MBF6420695.1 helix-turn-helix domain-containing protein [Nocardia farcinica]MBF6431939.1 helix-turn-helix domain-containing protein [Nocardia farcinica]MBF6502649.1 helix-turn-helix domain-containing protein [Nocardia farcinica]PFX05701.1 HTH-type transcriptional regulator CdhR [Nocardia farcinica]PFX10971.1 HTH-type transcriptional regulator CdhR [Nocardia farcinica]
MLSKVAVPLFEKLAMFEFGVVCEVFGLDRTADGLPGFDFKVCGAEPGKPLRSTTPGVTVTPEYDLAELARADLVAVPAAPVSALTGDLDPQLVEAVRAAAAAGATVLTVCSGAFVAGAAGLLDGRKCTTHWRYVDQLAARYPKATVDPDVLFVDEGDLITSAGTAAGIDACLHLVRREIGSAAANGIARRMVVPPQRDGGQRQFIERPVADCEADSLGETLLWMSEHLELPHTVESLAARASMSTRTFARRFAAETGTTPVKWLTNQRVLRAEHLLEETDLGLEQIAARCGFGSGALLRHHFQRQVGIAPTEYRRRFGRRPS